MNSLFKTVTESPSGHYSKEENVVSLRAPAEGSQVVFIKDLVLDMSIGIYETEKKNKQRAIVNVELSVSPDEDWQDDDIAHVVSYEDVINSIKALVAEGHYNLVETFAEKIIEVCFKHAGVSAVKVSVEKPDIFDDVAGVGVSISRSRK